MRKAAEASVCRVNLKLSQHQAFPVPRQSHLRSEEGRAPPAGVVQAAQGELGGIRRGSTDRRGRWIHTDM